MNHHNNRHNFSAGPGVLPEGVLAEAQQAITAVDATGLSVLGISHRSDWFATVVNEAESNIRQLLGLPDDYAVLFLQGGASLQFAMVPMLLLRNSGKTADYLRTGYWSAKAIPEARHEGPVRVLWDGEPLGFRRLPQADELACQPDAAYFHYVSNETVEGLQFHEVPGLDGVRRVCDMSSDFLSRPIDPRRYDLIYAHAQKNLGPAGVTVVILRRELLDAVPAGIPAILDYRSHLRADSIYNTPPVFAIYVTLLVTRWLLRDIGGLTAMARLNEAKAQCLYDVLDAHPDFYRGHAAAADRSRMNVVFSLADAALEAEFLRRAQAEGFSGLEGHRSLGGLRASIYNAMTLPAVQNLAQFMTGFRASRS
ncbi:phosphoserine transaminase [Denitratisoma sp. agr-D3]